MTNPWAKPGTWALDSEEHEDELLHQKNEEPAAADFPSLKAAAAAATKTKKKKPQAIPLSEFARQAQTTQSKGLTAEDLMRLPTGPRERTAEELDQSRLGGGFRSYGYNNRNKSSSGYESSNSKWGSSRVSDEPRKQSGELVPSRSDEVDDWGATKKAVSSNGFERRERGDRDGFFGSESRADESESWVSNKSFVPSEGRRFENARERGVGFESSGGADSDNWLKKKEDEGRKFAANRGSFDSIRERRGGFDSATNGGADSDTWAKKKEEGIGNGRRRLNLQPRTLPVGDNQQNGPMLAAKPKGSNPFGGARPREEVLREKGQDWKEIDEKLEAVKIMETGSATDGQPSWKRSFGSGNGRASLRESGTDKSWRKSDCDDSSPPSSDEAESGLPIEAENRQE